MQPEVPEESPADFFAVLGVPRSAAVDPELLKGRLRELGKEIHPDAGGRPDGAALEEVNAAYAALADPAKRLRHWMLLEFGEGSVSKGGAVAESLMGLFSDVAVALQRAEGVIERKEAARTAIAKAVVEPDVIAAQTALSEVGGPVGVAIKERQGRLEEVDTLAGGGADDRERARELADTLYRELAFLLKWQRQVQACFARLF